MNGSDDANDSGDGLDRTRRSVLTTAGLVGATAFAGCLGGSGGGTDTAGGDGMDGGAGTSTDATMGSETATDGMTGSGTDSMDGGEMGTDSMDSGSMASGWLGRELTDVTTGETFTIGQFDRPVVLETFAVWCPKCTSQQQNMQALRAQMGDDVVLVSLNTDPNEDASKVKSHVESHGFGWRYVVAPPDLTEALIEEFGTVVTSAPSAPVIIVCPDGSAELIDQRGVKSADTVASHLENC